MKTNKITLWQIKAFEKAALELYNDIMDGKYLNVNKAKEQFTKVYQMAGSYYYGHPADARNLKDDLTKGAYDYLWYNFDHDFEYGAFRRFIFAQMFNWYNYLELEINFDIDFFNVD